MTQREIVRLAAASAIVLALAQACSQGRAPFRTIQLCLAGPQEVPVFVGVMNMIAQQHRMVFTDRSGQTEAELRSIRNEHVRVAHPHVNIGADRNGEFSFGAGNLGLPTRQMAIGFNGSDAMAAQRFAIAAVAVLAKRWSVADVPRERGARPLRDCD